MRLKSLPFRFLCIFLPLCLATGSPRALCAAGPAPLRTHTLAPLHIVRASATGLIMPDATDAEWAAASVDFTWGNIWTYGFDDYRFDGEWIRTSFRFEQRSGRGAFGFEVPAIGRFGGILDSTIEGFHEQTGRGTQFRDRAPRNQVRVHVAGPEREFELDSSSWNIGDIALGAAWTLCADSEGIPGISVEVMATLPTGDPDQLSGLGDPSYGAGLTAAEQFGNSPLGLYLGLLYFHTQAEKLAGAAIRQNAVSGVAGAELRLGSRWSCIAQYLGQTPVLEGMRELSDPLHEISLGLRRRWRGGSSFEISLIENAGRFGNSTDLALHVGWQTVF